jgi:acyl dehydratase
MNHKVRQRHKETFTTVGTGLLVNYPLNLLGLYICIDLLEWTDSFLIGTTITAWMTVVAYTRVFLIRSYYDK